MTNVGRRDIDDPVLIQMWAVQSGYSCELHQSGYRCVDSVSYTHLDVYKRQALILLIKVQCNYWEIVNSITFLNN